MKEIQKALENFREKKILVLGDVMLDHYVWGSVERISPEAPVPVLDIQKEEYRLGGAANVALNLRTLNTAVYLCGIVGNDKEGQLIHSILSEKGIDGSLLVTDISRPTTLKTRIGAITQQIVRIDKEQRQDIPPQIEKLLLSNLKKVVPLVDGIILEDYNKGCLTERVISSAIKLALKHGKLITADPKQKNFFSFHKVDVFKPNYQEVQKNLGIIFDNDDEFFYHAWEILRKLKAKSMVVTRGDKGLYVFSDTLEMKHIPTYAKEVYDVSGAGDTVISVLTLALCEGCDIFIAADLANHAAGIVCSKMGTASVTIQEIIKSYNAYRQNNPSS